MNGTLDLQTLQRVCGELVIARIMAESHAAALLAENEKLKQQEAAPRAAANKPE